MDQKFRDMNAAQKFGYVTAWMFLILASASFGLLIALGIIAAFEAILR